MNSEKVFHQNKKLKKLNIKRRQNKTPPSTSKTFTLYVPLLFIHLAWHLILLSALHVQQQGADGFGSPFNAAALTIPFQAIDK